MAHPGGPTNNNPGDNRDRSAAANTRNSNNGNTQQPPQQKSIHFAESVSDTPSSSIAKKKRHSTSSATFSTPTATFGAEPTKTPSKTFKQQRTSVSIPIYDENSPLLVSQSEDTSASTSDDDGDDEQGRGGYRGKQGKLKRASIPQKRSSQRKSIFQRLTGQLTNSSKHNDHLRRGSSPVLLSNNGGISSIPTGASSTTTIGAAAKKPQQIEDVFSSIPTMASLHTTSPHRHPSSHHESSLRSPTTPTKDHRRPSSRVSQHSQTPQTTTTTTSSSSSTSIPRKTSTLGLSKSVPKNVYLDRVFESRTGVRKVTEDETFDPIHPQSTQPSFPWTPLPHEPGVKITEATPTSATAHVSSLRARLAGKGKQPVRERSTPHLFHPQIHPHHHQNQNQNQPFSVNYINYDALENYYKTFAGGNNGSTGVGSSAQLFGSVGSMTSSTMTSQSAPSTRKTTFHTFGHLLKPVIATNGIEMTLAERYAMLQQTFASPVPGYMLYTPRNGIVTANSFSDLMGPKGDFLRTKATEGTFWLDINSPTRSDLGVISKAFNVNPLVLEDVKHDENRERCDIYNGFVSITIRAPALWVKTHQYEQVSHSHSHSHSQLYPMMTCLIFPTCIITLHNSPVSSVPRGLLRLSHLRFFDEEVDDEFGDEEMFSEEEDEENIGEDETEDLIHLETGSTGHSRRGSNISERLSFASSTTTTIKPPQPFYFFNPLWIVFTLLEDIVETLFPVIKSLEMEVDEIDALIYDLVPQVHSEYHHHDGEDFMLRKIHTARKNVANYSRLLTGKDELLKDMRKKLRSLENYKYLAKHQHHSSSNSTSHDITSNGMVNVFSGAGVWAEVEVYFDSIQDRLISITTSLKYLDDLLTRSHANYLAHIQLQMTISGSRMNDIMGRLNGIAGLLLPLTLVTGLWGMNVPVPYMNLDSFAPFTALCGGLGVGTGMMYLYLKKNRWF